MPPYRVGFIGCGRIASTMEDQSTVHPVSIAGAFAAQPDAQIVAASNRGGAALAAFGQRWGVSALYQDYRAMLAHERLDVVVVATHPPNHAELVCAAAAAGARGIFCEKRHDAADQLHPPLVGALRSGAAADRRRGTRATAAHCGAL